MTASFIERAKFDRLRLENCLNLTKSINISAKITACGSIRGRFCYCRQSHNGRAGPAWRSVMDIKDGVYISLWGDLRAILAVLLRGECNYIPIIKTP